MGAKTRATSPAQPGRPRPRRSTFERIGGKRRRHLPDALVPGRLVKTARLLAAIGAMATAPALAANAPGFPHPGMMHSTDQPNDTLQMFLHNQKPCRSAYANLI